jgi:hypothetical protein
MVGHDFRNGFRDPPADVSRFIVQAPHQPAHDVARGLHIFLCQQRHSHAESGYGMPPDVAVDIEKASNKG